MPELPDLEHIVELLHAEFAGACIRQVEVLNPIIFRVLLAEPVEQALPGKSIAGIRRHGPFVVLELTDDLFWVVHPMLAGRFFVEEAKRANAAANCARMQFTNGKVLIYHDSKQMGKIYVLHRADLPKIPRFTAQGVDVLSREFGQSFFLSAISKSRKQVRVFLMEQETISAIGNAYADEILFAAKIHPKTFCYQLSEPQKTKLYEAILEVLQWGIAHVKAAARPIHEKVRDHMKVRNRQGQPCPVCGATIRRAGVRGYDAFFCPACQSPQRKQFIDWTS